MISPEVPIDTVDKLHHALQIAIEVELSTLPPYLTALWSIRRGTNVEAAEIVRSVAMEEMLHLVLVANVMNALADGLGPPRLVDIGSPEAVPTLPHRMPPLELPVGRLDECAIELFMEIEQPEAVGAPPQADRFTTIGQFYDAVIEGIELVGDKGFASGGAPQIRPNAQYYGGGGDAVEVCDAATAIEALNVIRWQGEGRDHGLDDGDDPTFGQHHEVGHYYRFQELQLGRLYRSGDEIGSPTGRSIRVDPAGIAPMAPDLLRRLPDLSAEVRAAIEAFDVAYRDMRAALQDALAGRTPFHAAVAGMYDLERLGRSLLAVPVGDGLTAGPLWRLR